MTSLPSTSNRVAFLVGPEQIEVRELPLSAPVGGEILLRVAAATTCGTDLKVFRRGGHPRMLRVPCPFGHEMSGEVAAVGPDVEALAAGQRVVVVNSASCGVCEPCRSGRENLCRDLDYLNGAFGRYLLVPERFVARSTYAIPEALPFELAALTEPLACVLHGIEVAGLPPGCDVVVLGCGPIGLMFVAALAHAGHRVVAADLQPRRLAVAAQLGAARTLAIPPHETAPGELAAASAGEGYSAVIEATGSPAAWETALSIVRPGGSVLLFGGCPQGTSVPLDTHRLHYSELTVRGAYHHRPATVRQALAMLASGRPDLRPLLSDEMPLDRLGDALEAMRRGELLKVVIRP